MTFEQLTLTTTPGNASWYSALTWGISAVTVQPATTAAQAIDIVSVRPNLATLKQRLDSGETSKEQARAELDAIPGLAEDIAEAEKQIDRMEAGGL